MSTSAASWHEFLCNKEMQKNQELDENRYDWKRKSLYLVNDSEDFNDIFKKAVTYDNIKSHNKTRASIYL